MSTDLVHLVPTDPWFVPAVGLEDSARSLYRELMPGGDEVESTLGWPMGFVHLVENSGDFRCQRCGNELDWEWVMGLMDEVEPKPLTLPCCSGTAELGDIRSDQGDCFAGSPSRSATPTAGTCRPTSSPPFPLS